MCCCQEVLTHLPLFMELPNSFLQALLLLLRENVGELVASFQESVEHPLIQLAEKLLARRRGRRAVGSGIGQRKGSIRHSREVSTSLNKPLSQPLPSSNLLAATIFFARVHYNYL